MYLGAQTNKQTNKTSKVKHTKIPFLDYMHDFVVFNGKVMLVVVSIHEPGPENSTASTVQPSTLLPQPAKSTPLPCT